MSCNNIAIVSVKGSAYRINFWYMNKDDAVNIMNGSVLLDERAILYKKILWCLKISENTNLTYFQQNRDVILNRAKDYYENKKERWRLQARN